jgi:alpha-ribazole phosphatase
MIALVRHPPAAIAPGICYGRRDLDLADPASVHEIAASLSGFAGMIWTSPARRCRAVADAIGPAHADARLLELNFGEWEGMRWDDVPRDALDRWADDPLGFAPPDGESGAELVARVTAFHQGLWTGDHIVIAHGGPLKVLIALLRGEPIDLLAPAPPLGSITRIG